MCVVIEIELKHDRTMISRQRIGEHHVVDGGVVGATPIDVRVNPLLPIPQTLPLKS